MVIQLEISAFINDIGNLIGRTVAMYLEKYMVDNTLFKLFEMPEKNNLATLRDSMIRIGEIERAQISLTNHADSFADLITAIEGEPVSIKQKYMKMCLHSAFREAKFRTIDEIVAISDKVVKDHKLMVSCLHPFKNYVDLLTNRLLSMSVDSVMPVPDNYLRPEEMTSFSHKLNDHIPKYMAAVKLAIDIKSSQMIEDSYKSGAIVLSYNTSKVALYVETENQVIIVDLDKSFKVTTQSDGSLKITRPDKRAKKKKTDDDKRKTTVEFKVSDIIEVRITLSKEEIPEIQCDIFP